MRELQSCQNSILRPLTLLILSDSTKKSHWKFYPPNSKWYLGGIYKTWKLNILGIKIGSRVIPISTNTWYNVVLDLWLINYESLWRHNLCFTFANSWLQDSHFQINRGSFILSWMTESGIFGLWHRWWNALWHSLHSISWSLS